MVYGQESKYDAPGAKKVELLTADKLKDLQASFDRFKKTGSSLMDCKHIPECLKEARIGEAEGLGADELGRIMRIAPICTSEEGLTFVQLTTIARDAFNVNMLHKLFEDANTDTGWEKVECFLDEKEIMALYKKLGMSISQKELSTFIENLDNDGDGRVDWEEFLTFSQELLGGRIIVAEDDPDGACANPGRTPAQTSGLARRTLGGSCSLVLCSRGRGFLPPGSACANKRTPPAAGTDFNQLRDDLKYFDDSLTMTQTVVQEYYKKIDEKKDEIKVPQHHFNRSLRPDPGRPGERAATQCPPREAQRLPCSVVLRRK